MSEYFRKYIKKENYPVHPSNIRFKTNFKNCIYEALKRRTWKESEGDMEWDIMWSEKEWIHEVFDHVHLQPHQRINHFRNYAELCRKDLMIKNMKRYKKNLEKEGKMDEAQDVDFFPLTYNMPGEYSLFVEEFKKNQNTVWIMKPIGKSQGKGIFLFTKLQQVSQWKSDFRWKPDNPQAEPYIVQRYINNPLLVGGKKFDLRLYVLVTNYSPLTAYVYRTGFARFTHHRYSHNPEDISNNYIHLTNVAVQKTSTQYDANTGGKWDLRQLKLYLISKYGQDRVLECFNRIHQIFIKSLLAVQKSMINDKHCFELYGYDVLIDSNLKPWLLEVNAAPSMTANTQVDFELKCNLLDDVFTIIDMEKVLQGNEEQVGGFDLVYRQNPLPMPANSIYSTYLGCYNQRNTNIKKLAKLSAQRLLSTPDTKNKPQ
jgi:tubulin polyglutamylase TTLL9